LLLLLGIAATSCRERSTAANIPEAGSGLVYTNYRVADVPWSIHVVRIDRSMGEFELHSTHAKPGALGLGTLSAQIRSLKREFGEPVAGVNGDFYERARAYAGDPRGLQIVEGELISAPI